MARLVYKAPYILNSTNKNCYGKVRFLNSTYLIPEFCIKEDICKNVCLLESVSHWYLLELWNVKSYPCNRPWRPIGLWVVEAPTLSTQSAHRWQWSCQPYVPAALYPQEDSWQSFMLEADSTPGPIVQLEGLGPLKNPMTSSGIKPVTFQLVA
jgi:hypothetical protein